MGNNKILKAAVAAAAIGGVCYAFRDKIKESKVYQSMDVDDKVEKVKNSVDDTMEKVKNNDTVAKVKNTVDDTVEKVKTTIKEKMPASNENERDYFTLNDDAVVDGSENTENNENVETAETDKPNDVVTDAGLEDTEESATEVSESIADITANVDDLLADIPKIHLTNSTMNDETEESPIIYENDGLSDVSEDIDVIEEQDKLDI
jgi:hypothetical protein